VNRGLRRVVSVLLASIVVLGVAIAALVAPGPEQPEGDSDVIALAAAAPTSAPADPAASASEAPTSTEPRFPDGSAARVAAVGLIGSYLESQMGITITDAACSEPPTGAAGETFVCYGLKPNNLVIALRATIGAERLIALDVITDQQPTTTTVAPVPESTAAA
jgi:hypothetical protein